ncbi:7392_t:CDS:2 [Funneliformis caledonium]|uniref:7392_t:CDS:1 n=1 Tax=Funneliformis caledonium TaxID=1117310 RepID=A0A9N8ZNX9_9GLOM|nr:7392_t:CDS:2 [Funneliformis caledonium]
MSSLSRVFIPNCDHKRFNEIADANPQYRMSLIEGRLEISMPVSAYTGQRQARIITQVGNWRAANSNLVGHFGS